ncbi:MAG: endonuclease III domain-containing protein [Candidatus Omnitrophica bacterium]|nr:endonuclease III domain-containing protein [Candidatus Omnitrophota bacterium]
MRPPRDRVTLVDIYKRLYRFYGPQEWWPARTRFEVIVGAILTQNTAWTNVEKAIRNLRGSKLLSPSAFKKVDSAALGRHIRPAGYYNIKSKRLKDFIGFLFSKYKGSLTNASHEGTDRLRHELLNVNGIGPETCDSILLYAFGRPVFVVDAYTKRVFSRHNFFREDAPYEDVQRFFMNNLPKKAGVYNEYHALIVRLAKDFCKNKPRCTSCPLKMLANKFLE